MEFTNEQKIGLSTAVFLVHDTYDYDPRPNAASTTGLLKSVRQAVLSKRAIVTTQTMDISALMASSVGSAIHDGIERAWSNGNYILALQKLGYPQKTIDRIVVNHGVIEDPLTGRRTFDPNRKPLPERAIPVYIEVRSEREVDGIILTGKFDFVGDGELEDHKTCGVFGYMKEPKNEKFRMQGSIYRWLNPGIITSDRMLINYTFTDWSKLRAMIEAKTGYPPNRMMSVPHTLMPLNETENWIRSKIAALKANITKPEEDLPLCTAEELWQEPTVYKYYRNPQNKTKSTKNFDNFAEAQKRLVEDGSTGCVDIVQGQVKACRYCPAGVAGICSQAKQLIAEGRLVMEE